MYCKLFAAARMIGADRAGIAKPKPIESKKV